ncbi:Uncharacterised protein [Vibrio cholerae]|nr:Uncharacterised protein [Vibrio cholerae]
MDSKSLDLGCRTYPFFTEIDCSSPRESDT